MGGGLYLDWRGWVTSLILEVAVRFVHLWLPKLVDGVVLWIGIINTKDLR